MNAVTPADFSTELAILETADAALSDARAKLAEVEARLPDLQRAIVEANEHRLGIMADDPTDADIQQGDARLSRAQATLDAATAIRDRTQQQLPELVTAAIDAESRALTPWLAYWRDRERVAVVEAKRAARGAFRSAYGIARVYRPVSLDFGAYIRENFSAGNVGNPGLPDTPDGIPRRQPRAQSLTTEDREAIQ